MSWPRDWFYRVLLGLMIAALGYWAALFVVLWWLTRTR